MVVSEGDLVDVAIMHMVVHVMLSPRTREKERAHRRYVIIVIACKVKVDALGHSSRP